MLCFVSADRFTHVLHRRGHRRGSGVFSQTESGRPSRNNSELNQSTVCNSQRNDSRPRRCSSQHFERVSFYPAPETADFLAPWLCWSYHNPFVHRVIGFFFYAISRRRFLNQTILIRCTTESARDVARFPQHYRGSEESGTLLRCCHTHRNRFRLSMYRPVDDAAPSTTRASSVSPRLLSDIRHAPPLTVVPVFTPT
jgi:hypothetical protein